MPDEMPNKECENPKPFLCDHCGEDLGKAIIDCKDDVKRGQMQVAWQRMLRMREHVEEASKVEGIAGPSRT